jgi:dTDP-4-amino-4,6-dideoxygalactose transaminase
MDLQAYEQLEQEYADFCGSRYSCSCNSGTSALHLALKAIGIKEGDEVIVPEFTMIACAFAVSYCNAKPVFVDCDDTLNIDVSLIEKNITKKTKAIMAVHVYGRLCNMKEILRIANKHNLKVIEDACEAQGAVYKSKADITCYSFFKNKIINAEEGGICTTNNKKYADRMRYLKNMAFGDNHDYLHAEIGFNYRMPDSQAELALHSLHQYKANAKMRRLQEKYFDKHLIQDPMPPRDAVWVYDLNCYDKVEQTKKELDDMGYQTRYFFKPMSMQPPYFNKNYKKLNAYKWSKQGLYIIL